MRNYGTFILIIFLPTVVFLSITACDSEDSNEIKLPPEICKDPGDGPYELSFTDITEELGLGPDNLDVAANTIAVADINGNNWPDIYVSQGSSYPENPEDPEGRYRLLENVGGESFRDVTWHSGLFKKESGSQGRGSSFVIFGDINNDGYVDALNTVYVDSGYFNENHPKPPSDATALFLNNGDGSFTLETGNDFSVHKIYNPISSATFADVNRDGHLDLFVGRHYFEYGHLDKTLQNSLYLGDGKGGFSDVTSETGLETEEYSEESLLKGKNHKPTWAVAACDIDGNGWPELMTASYGRQFNMLYKNEGGNFTDITLSSGFAHDGNEDFSDDQMFLCYCAENEAPEYCSGAADPVISCDGLGNAWSPGFSDQPYRLGGNSSGTLCEDFYGNGKMDLLSVELAHWWAGEASDKTRILKNENFPEKKLVSVPESDSGITRERSGSWNDGDLGAVAADFDNDGLMDILVLSSDYPGTHSLLYQQKESGVFREVSEESGTVVHRAHGGAYFDMDLDGDYDLVVGQSMMRWSSSDFPPRPEKNWIKVFRNDTGQDANRIMIDIAGAGEKGSAPRDASGARIKVHVGDRVFIREVKSSYGLYGFRNDSFIIIGLGKICQVDKLEVKWNDSENSVSEFTDIRANYVLKIRQNEPLKHMTLEEYRKK
ncbi:MAG: CRTAC1 family protein [bacterium]